MHISLTSELESRVKSKVESGLYNNASEVVREAIRLLIRTEEENSLKMERLRSAISTGDNALANGEFVEINSGQELDRFFGEL